MVWLLIEHSLMLKNTRRLKRSRKFFISIVTCSARSLSPLISFSAPTGYCEASTSFFAPGFPQLGGVLSVFSYYSVNIAGACSAHVAYACCSKQDINGDDNVLAFARSGTLVMFYYHESFQGLSVSHKW